MNRNTEAHFNGAPQSYIQRSNFDISFDHKTTWNAGKLVPIAVLEMLPGDTMKMDLSAVIRMATPIKPVMDNCYADFYAFGCPERLTWEHFKNFMGENTEDAWTSSTTYTKPKLTAPSGGWAEGTIADYMGIPTKVDNIEIDATYFRGYNLIWNDWFRSEPLKDPAHVYLDDTNRAGSNGNNYVTDAELGGELLPVAKFHDYFTSALPDTQFGAGVSIPIGGKAPVIPMTEETWGTGIKELKPSSLTWRETGGGGASAGASAGGRQILGYRPNGTQNFYDTVLKNDSTVNISSYVPMAPSNLWADLGEANSINITELRRAFAIQQWQEALARGGNRYHEIIRSIFNTISPDARQQMPEYLGGFRMPINVTSVLQTSSTDATTPQGNEAGYSVTTTQPGGKHLFTYSATEHTRIYVLMCIRTDNTYQQGLNRKFSRFDKFDYYWPQLANISETAILNKEIYAQGTEADEEAFGYQEAWAEYRMEPNRVSGHFRSNSTAGSLDSWHYADDYDSQPYLSSEWIDEPKSNIDRTLAVTSELAHQFFGDFYFKTIMTRPMPVYSIPGLTKL